MIQETICMDNKEILSRMSNQQKAQLFVGKNFWELEAIEGKNIFLSDGPHGIRKEIFENKTRRIIEAVCYPAACLSSCSFNKELMYSFGQELSKECIHDHIDVLLGPGINIKRSPLCGRNFEYFSEDPFLVGKLASSYINGVQSKHVGVSLKHFACNSQEYSRFVNNSLVDERTMREIYLKGFEMAIKEAHPWTIMASYNLLNGIHTTENYHLLTELGRNEFGFDGIYVSDWGAILNPIDSIKNGLDLEMPGVSKGSEERILSALKENKLTQEELDASTLRKIDLYLKTNQEKKDEFDLEHALSVCKKIDDESIVLLKNEGVLPLNRETKIALIGEFSKNPRFQGGGSSNINAIYCDNLFDEFTKEGLNFTYAQGYKIKSVKPCKKLIKEACETAKNSEVAIIMCGLPPILESEGYDRQDLKMPESHLKLIEEVCKVNKKVIVLLQNGSPIEMPFVKDVQGILECYLGGSKHASSIKDILLGKVNPSGRLSETFPLRSEDILTKDYYAQDVKTSLYKESIYVGYRYFDTFDKKVLFPFGYGLSYSKTHFNELVVFKDESNIRVKVKVTNETNIPCKEVVQIYIGKKDSYIFRAKKELKEFEKVSLGSHESKTIEFKIPYEELRYYSNKLNRYVLEDGEYQIYASKNVNDESLSKTITIDSSEEKEEMKNLDVYFKMDHVPTNEEFEVLYQNKLPTPSKRRPFNLESTIDDLCHSVLGFILFKPIVFFMLLFTKGNVEMQMIVRSLPNQPIRSLQMVGFTKNKIDGIVDIFNHHLIKGMKKVCSRRK